MSAGAPTVPSFTPIDHAARVAAVVADLADQLAEHVSGEPAGAGVDALLVTDLLDVRWLTGFTGSNGWVVVRGDRVVLGTDGRYRDRAAAETAQSGAEVIAETKAAELAARRNELLAGARVGLDASSVTHTEWRAMAASLDLRAMASPIRARRWVKSTPEIERMTFAARAASAALAEVEPMLRAGDGSVTEADVRDELEYRMRRHGADDRGYATIVAAGPEHAARPHHEVGRRPIVDGDTLVIDVGGAVDGYRSDMTRSWVIGASTAQQRELYELVAESQRRGLAAVAHGVAARDVDAACRDFFAEHGYADWYVHGTGHGVGLQIHEPPFHSQVSTEALAAGNVVTVEPGLYRVGFGGFRVEDLVVVTDDGHELVTHYPYAPFAD